MDKRFPGLYRLECYCITDAESKEDRRVELKFKGIGKERVPIFEYKPSRFVPISDFELFFNPLLPSQCVRERLDWR